MVMPNRISLPNLKTLNGNLIIESASLSVIYMPLLETINGQLVITQNWGLSNVSFPNLTTINASAKNSNITYSVVISDLQIGVLDLKKLQNVTARQFLISELPRCTRLELNSMIKVDGDLILENFLGTFYMQYLKEVRGRFTIANISLLATLKNIANLTLLDGLFEVRNNPNLTSISGPVNGLSNLTAVYIGDNPKLPDLTGLHNLETTNAVTIQRNVMLNSIGALSFLKYIGTLKLDNLPSVTNISSLLQLKKAAQVQFLSMPGIKEIGPFNWLDTGGFVVMNCQNLLTFHGAPSSWNAPTRGAIIVTNNPVLHTLGGFEDVGQISDLIIQNNRALKNISGFNSLNASETIQISDNNLLENVDFLHRITKLKLLLVTQNPRLTDLSGLSHITSVSTTLMLQTDNANFVGAFSALESVGWMTIKGSRITSLAGFEKVRNVKAIKLFNNNELTDVSAMDRALVETRIHILYNPFLRNISGFGRPTLLDSLIVEQCPVESFSAVSNLEKVNISVSLSNLLINLSDFKTLKHVGELSINGLPNIKNLDGFKSLETVESLRLVNNPQLEHTRALCRVKSGGGMVIARNPLLCCSAVLKTMSLAVHNRTSSRSISITDCMDDSQCQQNSNSLATCSCGSPDRRCGVGSCSDLPGPNFECSCPLRVAEGMLCQFSIPELHACVPHTVDMEKREIVEIRGVRFPELPNVTIDNMTARVQEVNASSTTFHVRAPNTSRVGYALVTLVNYLEEHEWADPKPLIYFADLATCNIGTLLRGGECICPSGAYCPGGPRMWPIRGWWSENEMIDPTRCRLPQSCPGSIGEERPPVTLDSGARQTNNCATGYMGIGCGTCAPTYALSTFGECISCGLTADERYGVTSVVITAVVLAAVLSACVAIFDEERMALAATGLMGLQRAVTTGQICASHYGSATISDIFAQLSFFNFDLQFVKPGCTVSRLSYDGVFWGTIVVCLIAAILFIFASFLRAFFIPETSMTKARTEEEAQDAAFEREFNPDYVGFKESEFNSPEESGATTPNQTPPRISLAGIELETKSSSSSVLHPTRRETEMNESKHHLPANLQTPQLRQSLSEDNVEIVTLNPPPMIRKRSTASRKDSSAEEQPYLGGSGNMSMMNQNNVNRTRSSSNAEGVNRNRSGSTAERENNNATNKSPSKSRTRSSSNAADRGRQLEELARREADYDPNDAVFDTSEGLPPPPPPPPPPPHPVLHSPTHSASLLDTQSSKSIQTVSLPHTTSVGGRKRKHVYTRKALFKRRAVHSLIILGSILHFQLCLKTMQGLVCDHNGDSFFLRAELSTPCYSGEHVGTMVFIVLLLLGYCIGFPIWCAFQLKKVAGGANELKNKAKIQRFGFLYRDLRPEFYWFRHSAFVVNFLLALFAVAIHVGPAQTFWTSLVMLIYTLAIVFLLPFENWKNCVPLTLSMLSLIQFVVVLAIDATGENKPDTYVIAFVVLAMLSCVMGFIFRRHKAYFMERFARLPRIC